MIYLSDQWFTEATAGLAAARFEPSDRSPVRFSYVVEGVPPDHPTQRKTIPYVIALNPAAGTAVLHQDDDSGDVQFVLQYHTALEVAMGSRSGSRAFLDGDIRVGGDVAVLIERAKELEALAEVLPTPAASDA